MKKLFALILCLCLCLCGCGKKNNQITVDIADAAQVAYVPRSVYVETENRLYNPYAAIDVQLPEKWTAYTDSHSLGQLHNLTDSEREALDCGRWDEITTVDYIPDFIIYGEKGGDKISVVYYPVADGVTAESCRDSYVEMFRNMNSHIADSRSTHSRMHPMLPSGISADGDAFEPTDSGETTAPSAERDLDFYTAEIKAEYWGKNAYEYGAFAQISDEYIMGVLFSTTSGTDAESFWDILGF